MTKHFRTNVVAAIVVAGAMVAGAQPSIAGRAMVSLTGSGLSVSGEYPATVCGGPYLLGSGMAYRTTADEWQITIASENRTSGDVPLNEAGGVNVVVTVNGPGTSFVRRPENGGTLTVSADFKKVEADLELREAAGRGTARLVATFVCQ